jgi:protein SCO1/2
MLLLSLLGRPALTAAQDDRAPGAVKSTREYTVPPVRLVRDDGKAISLPDEMNDGRPVLLQFIFTSCTSFCPLLSSTFAQFERRLGAEAGQVHLMSISIDPETDTPATTRARSPPAWRPSGPSTSIAAAR